MNPQDVQTPASPLGNFPELAAMFRSSFQVPLSNAQASVQATQDQISVENAKRAASEANSKAEAFANPKNYTVVQRPDGGYGFYGPDGKEVTAAQYAQVAGKLPADILKDSSNPIDQRYIQDSKNLSAYYKAKAQSKFDKGQAAIAKQIEKDVKNSYGIDLAKTPHQQILQAFYSNYPTIYGPNKNNAPGFSGSNLFVPGEGTAVGKLGGRSYVNSLNYGGGGNSGIGL